jgi:formyltetrahydrofolate deformylase
MSNIAALLFTCPDQVGIISSLANFFAERKLNITRYEEYTDAGQFFSRLEWQCDSGWQEPKEFNEDFASLAESFGASFDVRFFDRTQRVGLFASKQPHALIEVFNKSEAGYFPNTDISFVIGNDEAIGKVANRHGVPFFFVDTKKPTEEYEAEQLEIVSRYKPHYVGLARYMKVLSEDFINKVGCPVVNIHHSFLPSFVGAKPYQMAYERGVKLIGATSHFVTPELDQGPIIEQDVQRVAPGASLQDMIKMGRDIEQKVFAKALLKTLEHKVIVYQNRTVVFN